MNFNLKKTAIYQAIKWEKFFSVVRICKILAWFLCWVALAGFVFNYFHIIKSALNEKMLLFLLSMFFALALLFTNAHLFFEKKLKNPRLKFSLNQALNHPDEFNWAGFLDFASAKAYLKGLKKAKKSPQGSLKSFILLSILQSHSLDIYFVFQRGEIKLKEFIKAILQQTQIIEENASNNLEKIIIQAAKNAQEHTREKITCGDLLVAFAFADNFTENFLIEKDTRKEDIQSLVQWYYKIKQKQKKLSEWWSYENLLTKGSLGKDFSAGYAITLQRFSEDLTEKISRNILREVIGHQEEVKQIERVLEREEVKNVLLVGEPGTGRSSIVEALTQKAFLGKSLPAINYKRFIKFDVSALVNQAQSAEEAEFLLEKCFSEAVKARNIILVINDFHNYVSPNPQPGMMNISGIMSRYLALNSFQVIAITTFEGFHNTIEPNSAFSNFFEKVQVQEISEQETLLLLEQYVPFFEHKYQKEISFRALKEILKLSSRYFAQTPFPQKAIRLLDEAMVYLRMYTKDKVLRDYHIQKIVTQKTKIPIEALGQQEKRLLLNLEELIHNRLINQEEAVYEMASALRRARAQVNIRTGPIGSFLFLGPTGVGKTEAAKTLSEIYFGSEQNMIRFDMSEFQTTEDIKRLIGTTKETGLLTNAVKEKPFCLLLLDELEKAHFNILNLFLQILDEGWVTDGLGRKVDFKNTIIIATSNAAAEIIMEDIKLGRTLAQTKEHVFNFIFQQRLLKPEFINRFDGVILFKPLGKQELLQIAGLMLSKLAKNLLDKGVKFEITSELKQKIVELSYSPSFGAREMRRVIQDKVENSLAKALLLGELKRGNMVCVNVEDFSLKIK